MLVVANSNLTIGPRGSVHVLSDAERLIRLGHVVPAPEVLLRNLDAQTELVGNLMDAGYETVNDVLLDDDVTLTESERLTFERAISTPVLSNNECC